MRILISSGPMYGHVNTLLPLALAARRSGQLVIAQGGDQFVNAQACRQAGAALSLAKEEVTPAGIRAAADRLLTEAAFAEAARAVQREIAAMPDADALLTTLAEDRRVHSACHA